MIIIFIVGLLLGVVSVIFALQNIEVITVSFFSWQLTGSLSMILLLALTTGAVIALLILLPEFISHHLRYRKLNNEKLKLEEDLRKQKELTIFAKQVPPTAEDIQKIEQGAIAHPEN